MKTQHGLLPEERKRRIIEILDINESVSVPELVALFGVTGATIRNDLRELENGHFLVRTHGGAVSVTKRGFEDKPDFRSNDKAKQLVAAKALSRIVEGDSIVLDTGTTNLELAKQIARSNIKNLRIITNDFKIASVLEENRFLELIVAGGMVRKEFHCCVGYQTIRFIEQFAVDKAFLGTSAISVTEGLSTPNILISEFKEAIMRIAKQTIIISDSSKMGKSSFCRFATISEIDSLIIDKDINPNHLEKLFQFELDIILA